MLILMLTVFMTGVSGSGFVRMAQAQSTNTYTDVDTADLVGHGTDSTPYEISNVSELQAMEDGLTANYELVGDIDASNTAQWNDGRGFDPVGSSSDQFAGSLDGNNHTITGLTIDRQYEDNSRRRVGLFGYSFGTITDVALTEVTVTGNEYAGGLVGLSTGGTIRNVTVSGKVRSTVTAGGLAGQNFRGAIQNATASVNVTSDNTAGGLVGFNSGSIRNARASGSVAGDNTVGGLVGSNRGIIRDTFAVGNVTGNQETGGLVGRNNDETGTVEQSYFDTQASGQDPSGGSAIRLTILIFGPTNSAIGLTTGEMQGSAASENMSGLKFGENWQTVSGGYPELIALSDPDSDSDSDSADGTPKPESTTTSSEIPIFPNVGIISFVSMMTAILHRLQSST